MGKKGDRKRAREETEDEDEIQDPELQAEIAAIMAMKEEQKQSQNGDGEEQESKPKASVYNKDAMMQLAESMGVDSMPFIENMQISEYELAFQDENDDLEREVSNLLRADTSSYTKSNGRWPFIITRSSQ